MKLLERIIRGPDPRSGVPYLPAPSLRCRVGLHLWAETWQAFPLARAADGLGRVHITFMFNLDRAPDFEACVRCGTVRHRVPEPSL